MRERWRTIRNALFIILFSFIGLIEYVQLMQSFDLPQIVLIIPLVNALAMILLKKKSLFVPVCTIFLSCLYQILEGDNNAISQLGTDVASVAVILLQCLSVLVLFQFVGLGCGMLIRIFFEKKRQKMVRIVCGVLGVFFIIAPYLFLFGNPLYPITARKNLTAYADNTFTDYAIAGKKVYYSMQAGDYVCRVSMADGQIRIVVFDEEGNPKQQ